MDFTNLKLILAEGGTPPAPTQPNPQGEMIKMVGTFALMGIVFYFLLIRPQQKKAKDQAALLKTIRAGDKIITASGIVGVVISVKEKSLSIRSADAKLEITKSAVAEITERSGDSGGES